MHVSKGTYNVNSFFLTGNSTLVIDSGPVILNLAGTSLASGSSVLDTTGGSVSNPSGLPENFQINYAGSNPVQLAGGSGAYAVVYAPKALVKLVGNAGFYGAIISNTFSDLGGASVHYDRGLLNFATQASSFRLTSFTWSKY